MLAHAVHDFEVGTLGTGHPRIPLQLVVNRHDIHFADFLSGQRIEAEDADDGLVLLVNAHEIVVDFILPALDGGVTLLGGVAVPLRVHFFKEINFHEDLVLEPNLIGLHGADDGGHVGGVLHPSVPAEKGNPGRAGVVGAAA